jgi:hypothetical protein
MLTSSRSARGTRGRPTPSVRLGSRESDSSLVAQQAVLKAAAVTAVDLIEVRRRLTDSIASIFNPNPKHVRRFNVKRC